MLGLNKFGWFNFQKKILVARLQAKPTNNSPILVVPAFSHASTQNQPGFNGQHGVIIQNGYQSLVYPANSGSFSRPTNAPVYGLPEITD